MIPLNEKYSFIKREKEHGDILNNLVHKGLDPEKIVL